ncbi:MAG: SPOR domain-containing protein [Fodinibius sp.]|nr:SPOR domain-containing protein [Fodinibius sp.]
MAITRAKAKAQVQKWVDRGYENAHVVKSGNEETGDIWFRVRLGHLATKDMAEKLEAKLKREFNEPSWTSMAQQGSTEGESQPEE